LLIHSNSISRSYSASSPDAVAQLFLPGWWR
jgi:hypothetical protein